MRIERDAQNSFTLAARATLTPSRWLLRFNRENDPDVEQLCIADSYGSDGMPVLLTFTEVDSSPDPQDAEVTLNKGQWRLRVYEQTTTSLNYANSDRQVYDVLVEVDGPAAADPEPTDPCDGEGDCPTDCEVIEGMDASEIVACVPSGDRTALLCEVMDTAEATPEAIVVCLDGANKTDAVRDIICTPCPECDPLTVLINGVEYVEIEDPCDTVAGVRVKDADDNDVGSLDGTTWRIPSVTVQLKDSANNNIGSADIYLPGANTTKTAPDATVQLKDSAGVNIGSADSYRSNTSNNKTAPDGTVTINNSVPTTLHTVAVKSNGSATQAIADSTITKPDGTTVGLPATVALDVRDYRSGIQYQFGDIFWSGQTVEYRTGDEGTLWAAGWFSYTPPVYPLRLARLGADRVTLAENNVHGNTNRFTDRSGGQTYSDDIVQDHLTGIEWYRVLQTAATWNNAIDGALALSVGGNTDWKLPTTKLIDSIANDAAGNASNSLYYAPFSISNSNYWTSSTYGVTTTSAWRMSAQSIVAGGKTSPNAWLACRRFI